MFFGARDDAFLMQPGDGYSAMVGGVKLVSTDAQASLFGGKIVATIPHALIALCGGDTVKATKRFAEMFEGVELIALVDYANDSVKTSVDVANALEGRLWGVRLDTAETMVDKSVMSQMGAFKPTGVNAALVWNVRNALDAEGFGEVKIVASGGFDAPRIFAFEEDGVPVDAYGVGSALFDGRFDFTADVVQVNGKAESKAGRTLRAEPEDGAGQVAPSVPFVTTRHIELAALGRSVPLTAMALSPPDDSNFALCVALDIWTPQLESRRIRVVTGYSS